MKVWITRNLKDKDPSLSLFNAPLYDIWMWKEDERPKRIKGRYHSKTWKENGRYLNSLSIARFYLYEFKKLFGFIPKKGSCQLKEIKILVEKAVIKKN